MPTQDAATIQGSGSETASHAAPPHPLMFWVLLALATMGFAPCILLPVWRDYEATALQAQAEERSVAQFREAVADQRRRLEAIRTDPAVSVRLAQRELSYRRRDQVDIPIPGVETAKHTATAESLTPVEPPVAVARVVRHLPEADYDRIFCDGPTRLVIMLLSAGLIVAAFVLYPPTPAPAPDQATA